MFLCPRLAGWTTVHQQGHGLARGGRQWVSGTEAVTLLTIPCVESQASGEVPRGMAVLRWRLAGKGLSSWEALDLR